MAISENTNAFVEQTATSIALSQMFTVTPASTDPTYLVLTVLDRNEYTAGASGATGTLVGNGNTLNLGSLGSDGRGAGIVFTYQAATGRYYNSTYGYLDQLVYNSSASPNDVTNLSLFGTSSLSQANAYASNAYAMMQVDAAGYLGSATVATQTNFTGTVPVQATPDSIATVADSFVGRAWNMDGCWVLASTIAAEAGASLPVQSTLIGLPGQSNGEWIVAFNGPAGQSGNWQSMVTEGEIVVIGTPGGGGHITTCVSGTGSTAMLVDNITYVNGSGQIVNPANDGSSNDIIVSAPHIASQEWSGVAASSVVIYELDTPIVTDTVSSETLAAGGTLSLGALFSATDPASKTITEWQVYDTATGDTLVSGGTSTSDHSAATALTVASLGSVSLDAGGTATTDTLEVRAFNGSYWGDWMALAVTVSGSATPPAGSPVVETPTPGQTWTGGKTFSLALPAGTFQDPNGETLIYAANLAGGQALPSWLGFNAATDTFSGTAPITAQTLNIMVTATDTSGLSVSETFVATVLGAPVVTAHTANQTWAEGKAISLPLPANTFTDPQGETLTYTATQSNGQVLPSWLSFNAATDTFSGTTPITAQTIGITVTATDTAGLSASETFSATVQAGPVVAHPTANQTWNDKQRISFTLPNNTFTDSSGESMTYAAYQTAGTNATSWLHFSGLTFSGTVPGNASGTINIEVIATDTGQMSASETFAVTFASAGHGLTVSGIEQILPPVTVSGAVAFHS